MSYDYWREVMYKRIKETLVPVEGQGVEFGGSNGIIQGMFPKVTWEVRKHPPYDIIDKGSYERDWDVIVADQILEHVARPWDAMELIGKHTKQVAIITVPFLIGLHMRPRDYWRMTPRTIQMLASPYFTGIHIDSWGSAKVAYWHAIYNRTERLLSSVPEVEWEQGLKDNDPNKPFVIWAILRK